ncbi:hypothetical protein [Pseudactinotalea sp. Z1748]|uniref:hypothetical protein n=1 Tax=Pseudactinotalea sp. Z1748 TaxID=3413027 RepID=UPI003C7BE94E
MHNLRSLTPATSGWTPQPRQQQAQQTTPKPTEPPKPEGEPGEPEPHADATGNGFKSEHSKQSVLSDLARERAERQQLKAELDTFKSSIAEAFGVKPEPADDGKDLLSELQDQVATMRHESALLRLANQHKITDEQDLELLGTAKDAEAMEVLAKRLAPSEDGGQGSGIPKPDLTQGARGEPVRAEALPGVPRMAQAFDDAMSNTRK